MTGTNGYYMGTNTSRWGSGECPIFQGESFVRRAGEGTLHAYDAVRFGHRASNSVSVHKGNLGVGVSAPDVTLRGGGCRWTFRVSTEGGMTGYETYMEGHGVFRVSASSERNNGACRVACI